MKPPLFDYRRVQSVAQATEWLHEKGDEARILAGGQSLVILLNMRLAQPGVLLDISGCEELDYVREQDGRVCVGASTTQAKLQAWPGLQAKLPLLAEAIPFISHYQIRNRGTVAGSIAHADPSAELALCLATLGGQVVLRSRKATRVLSAGDFQQGLLTTARRSDELVVEVRFPVAQAGCGYAFDEFSLRRGDFAIVACAAQVSQDGIRLGVGGVADKPVAVQWPWTSGDALRQRLNDLAWQLQAQDDQHATAAYRRHLVRELGLQVIRTAAERGSAKKD